MPVQVGLESNSFCSVIKSPTSTVTEVFKESLGTLKGFKAHIHMDLRYCKARSIPYAFKVKVEEELDRLVTEGTLEAVQTSELASPIVPVLKPDQTVFVFVGTLSKP